MRRRRLAAVLVVLALAATWLAAETFWIGPGRLVVRDVALEPPKWPDALDGLKIALLSDLHTGSPRNGPANLARVVDATNAVRPDLVLLAGDFVIHDVIGGTFVEPEAIARELARLEAPLGVFAVLGNHDWWLSATRVREALETHGIAVIDDRAARLTWKDATFYLAGISDYWEGPHDVRAALAQVPEDATILALTHNPDVLPDIPSRVSLTLAGHTHGGQVDLPLLGRLVVPSRRIYAFGHVVDEGRHVYVTSGVGTSILPVRFRVPPEISVLTLRAQPGDRDK
ncbi:MAG: metallophosphoesterase [Planctomycetes bacterium]|nr:metallophosphoesterase [Planctomycetota bacterium]